MNSTAKPPRQAAAPQQRSQLVTIFAWINIVISILGAVASLGLLLLFRLVLPADEMLATLQRPDVRLDVPAGVAYALQHVQGIFAASLALSLLTLVTSYALLKRRNWARLFWVAAMALIVVWSLAGLFVHPDMSTLLPASAGSMPPELQAQMQAMVATARFYGYAISLVQAGLFSWAIWRFCSADIRGEFTGRS